MIENDILLSPQTFSRVNIYYQNYDELVQLVQTPEISEKTLVCSLQIGPETRRLFCGSR